MGNPDDDLPNWLKATIITSFLVFTFVFSWFLILRTWGTT